MDDPLVVRGFERLGDLLGDRECLVEGKRTAGDALVEALAVHELEDEELNPARAEGRQDLRGAEPRAGGQGHAFSLLFR